MEVTYSRTGYGEAVTCSDVPSNVRSFHYTTLAEFINVLGVTVSVAPPGVVAVVLPVLGARCPSGWVGVVDNQKLTAWRVFVGVLANVGPVAWR
jgi:hypothetical protein